jgi:enoyl-CoA hydratase/carnithine racemase
MNKGAAMEMLCFNAKFDANEAKFRGLVTRVFPKECFLKECHSRLESYALLPMTTLTATKRLVRKWEIPQLHE